MVFRVDKIDNAGEEKRFAVGVLKIHHVGEPPGFSLQHGRLVQVGSCCRSRSVAGIRKSSKNLLVSEALPPVISNGGGLLLTHRTLASIFVVVLSFASTWRNSPLAKADVYRRPPLVQPPGDRSIVAVVCESCCCGYYCFGGRWSTYICPWGEYTVIFPEPKESSSRHGCPTLVAHRLTVRRNLNFVGEALTISIRSRVIPLLPAPVLLKMLDVYWS